MGNITIFKNSYSIIFFVVFWCVCVLSNSVFIIFNTSSLRAGMVIGILFMLGVVLVINKTKITVINKKYLYIVFFLCAILMAQTFLSTLVFGMEKIERSTYSIVLLIIVAIIAPYFVNMARLLDENSFHRTVKFNFIFMALIGIVSIILQRLEIISVKSMIIFAEPSHYAFVFLPLVLYIVITANKKHKLLYLLLCLLIAFSVENLTLLVGLFLVFVVTYWRHKLKFLLLIGIMLSGIIWGGIDTFSYYLDRLSISINSNNLSVLVWVSGWDRAIISFTDSYGIGLGFQRLGYVGENGIVMERIYEIMGGQYLNYNDGASVAPKMIAETGVLGLSLLFFYILYFLRVLKVVMKHQVNSKVYIFFYSVYLMFSVQLFVRGVGYFSPSTFIFCSSIYFIVTMYKKNSQFKKIGY